MTVYTYRELLVLAARETTYGADAVAGAANAMLLRDVTMMSMKSTPVERDVIRGYMGANPKTQTQVHREMAFTIDWAGSGTAGTAPPVAPILRSGAMAETVVAAASIQAAATKVGTPTGTFTYTATGAYTGATPRRVTLTCTTAGGTGTAKFTVASSAGRGLAAVNNTAQTMTTGTAFALANGATITPTIGTSFVLGDTYTIDLDPPRVDYSPVTSGFDALSIWTLINNQRRRMLGARGKLSFEGSAGVSPSIRWDGVGLWVDNDTQTPPAVGYSAFLDPVAVSDAVTDFSIHGYPAAVKTFKFDSGADFDYLGRINAERIAASNHPWTGSLVFDLEDIATFDAEARSVAGTLGPLWYLHGTVAGNIVRASMPSVQLSDPVIAKGDKDTWEVSCNFSALPVAGNDEVRLSYM